MVGALVNAALLAYAVALVVVFGSLAVWDLRDNERSWWSALTLAALAFESAAVVMYATGEWS